MKRKRSPFFDSASNQKKQKILPFAWDTPNKRKLLAKTMFRQSQRKVGQKKRDWRTNWNEILVSKHRLGCQLLKKHHIVDWKLIFCDQMFADGATHHNNKMIFIKTDLAFFASKHEFVQLMLHEIAHVIRKAGRIDIATNTHDSVWRRTAKRLGCIDPREFGNVNYNIYLEPIWCRLPSLWFKQLRPKKRIYYGTSKLQIPFSEDFFFGLDFCEYMESKDEQFRYAIHFNCRDFDEIPWSRIDKRLQNELVTKPRGSFEWC